MQIRHNPLSGGYCGEVPPLPIPNREVKLTCADGTAMQCGRVGSRLLLSRASDFERFLRLFCFHADFKSVYLLSTSSVFFNFCCSICLNHDMYKMLTDCGFSFIKSAKLRTKMFLSTKKSRKFPPPFIFFSYFCPKKMRTIM